MGGLFNRFATVFGVEEKEEGKRQLRQESTIELSHVTS